MDAYVQDELPVLVSVHERAWVKLTLSKRALSPCCGADVHRYNISRQRWVVSPLRAEGFALHERQTHGQSHTSLGRFDSNTLTRFPAVACNGLGWSKATWLWAVD